MSHEVDRAYYQQCAAKEREKAAEATDVAIRHTHVRLAEMYESKVRKMMAHADMQSAEGTAATNQTTNRTRIDAR